MSQHILYNPRAPKGGDIKSHWFDYREWDIPANSLFQTEEEHIVNHFKETFGFLQEVKQTNLEKVRKEMENKEFICDDCQEGFMSKGALVSHQRTHGFQKDDEQITGVPVLTPKRLVKKGTTIKRAMTQEQMEAQEGVGRSGTTDQDGVAWYGSGLQEDTGMQIKKPGDPGMFRG